jgi:hypothetical protein
VVRRNWLQSEPGKIYVARAVEPGGLNAQAAHRERRTLERRMKRVAKRAEAVESVRVKALIAKELGHASLQVPSRTTGTTQFVRAMDASLLSAIRQHDPQAQRQAYARVKSLQRSRSRGLAPDF